MNTKNLKNFIVTLLLLLLTFQAAPLARAAGASELNTRAVATPISSVTVSAITINNYRYGGATAKLRIYASETFDQAGEFVIGSARGSGQWYQQVNCTVAGTVVSVPSFSLPVTTTSTNPAATYTFVFVDSKGTEREVYLSEIQVPDTFGATVTFSQLYEFSTRVAARPRPNDIYSKDQVNALLAADSPCPDGSDSVKGCFKLSVAPASSTNPIAVGDNDPRLSTAVSCSGTNDSAALIAAYTAGGTVRIANGSTCAADSTVTFPTSVVLKIEKGGFLKPITGQTPTILSHVEAGPYQIFTNALSGQGTISFSGNKVLQVIYDKWFGTVGDGVVDDAAAINAFLASIPDGRTGQFTPGAIYKHTAELLLDHKSSVTISGVEADMGYSPTLSSRPIFYATGFNGGNQFRMNNCYAVTVKGLFFASNDAAASGAGATRALYMTFTPGGSPGLSSKNVVKSCHFQSFSARTDWVGLDIDNINPPANNEQHQIILNTFVGSPEVSPFQPPPNGLAAMRGIGLRLGHSQVKQISIDTNLFTSLAQSVSVEGGNFQARNNIHSVVNVCWGLGFLLESNSIKGDDGEHFLQYITSTQIQGALEVHSNRLGAFRNDQGAGDTFPVIDLGLSGSPTFVDISNNYIEIGTVDSPVGTNFIKDTSGQGVVHWSNNQMFGISLQANVLPGLQTFKYFTVQGGDPSNDAAMAGLITGGTRFGMPRGLYNQLATSPTLRRVAGVQNHPLSTSITGEAVAAENNLTFGDDGELELAGLSRPNLVNHKIVGTAGVQDLRSIAVIALDSLGNRTLASPLNQNISNAPNTLNGSNYVTFTWPAVPGAATYTLLQFTSGTWRVIAASIAPSGTALETYNLQANPAGAFTYLPPAYNETARWIVRGQITFPNEVTLTANDTTPSVAKGSDFVTANSSSTTVSALDDMAEGTVKRIRVNDANTTWGHASGIITTTGANLAATNGRVYQFVKRGSNAIMF